MYVSVGATALPVPPALQAMIVDTDPDTGLRVVSYQTAPLVVAALQLGSFQPAEGDIDPQMGLAVGGAPTAWVDDYVAGGNMVMVRTEAVSGGLVEAAITQDPYVIANLATASGGFAMLKGPPALAVQARDIVLAEKQGKPPPVFKKPALPKPASEQAAAGVPGWIVGVGLFGVGALALMALVRRRP